MIYLTDYIENADIERAILSDRLWVHGDSGLDKKRVEVLLIWHFSVSEAVLREYPKLKAVVRYGVGVDNIDLDACKRLGVKVFNNPDYGVDEVSDTAIAMLMALSRNIIAYDHVARTTVEGPNCEEIWQEQTITSSKRLSDCRLGIVGVGRIGSAVARKMMPLVANVGFYDPFVKAGYDKALRVRRYDDLHELLNESDLVTVHVPLSELSAGMINKEFLSNLKTGAILVNTARGGLIEDLNIFEDALVSGRLAGLGLDVLPEEPPHYVGQPGILNQWLTNSAMLGRIIINPHTSYYSEAAYEEMRKKAAVMALNASLSCQQINRII